MKAILLAAGVGKRLRPYTEAVPKCLVEVGGRSLLHRHLDTLSAIDAFDGIVIVVGYRHDQIRDQVAAWHSETGSEFPVTFIANEQYTLGSILSLGAAREVLVSHDCVAMDADVLYPTALMQRLVDAPARNCFLLDDGAEDSGEEMMVCVKDGFARHIGRAHDPSTQTGWDHRGEGVGFFKLSAADAASCVAAIDATVADVGPDNEYEVALARFMKDFECGWVSVADLPWTEIDFEEDIDKAASEVLPRIQAL